MSRGYEQELAVALGAVRLASRLCRSVRAGIDPGVIDKGQFDPVTVADFGSQALVCRALAEAFPGDPIAGEEDSAALSREENAAVLEAVLRDVRAFHPEGDADAVRGWIDLGGGSAEAGRFWTLDPIDGTKGFLRGDQYAIALALIVEGRVAVAALACPGLHADPQGEGPVGAVFTAVRGAGAFVHAIDGEGAGVPIAVGATDDPASARYCESVESAHSAHGDAARIAELLGISAEPVRIDSQAKYALVARGAADIYLRVPTRPGRREKIWDHAAGALVIEEAGGVATDLDGLPLDFSRGRQLEANRGVIVTNGRLHARVLDAIRQLGL